MGLEREKLRALAIVGAFVQGDPFMAFVLGLLAGASKRVHFVRHLEEAPVAVELAAGRARVWPRPPFRAWVRGVTLPDPLTLATTLAQGDEPICVRVHCEALEEEEFFQALRVDSYADVAAGRTAEVQAGEARLVDLRARIDRALDVYNECLRLLREGDPQRKAELQAFLRMAQAELKHCGSELRGLEEELQQARG